MWAFASAAARPHQVQGVSLPVPPQPQGPAPPSHARRRPVPPAAAVAPPAPAAAKSAGSVEAPKAFAALAAGGACLLARGAAAASKPRRRRRAAAAARRCLPPEGTTAIAEPETSSTSTSSSLVQRPVQPAVDDEDAGGAGDSCTVWLEDKDPHHDWIAQELLESDWAPLMDKVKTIEGAFVRANQKGAKQVATLGPSSSSPEALEQLFLCGVDVFRLNFSHGDHEEKTRLIDRIRSLEMKYKHPICILADMQGPKQRCGKFENKDGVELKVGQEFRFDLDPTPGDERRAELPHPEILLALTPGKMLLLDDGKIRMRVLRTGYTEKGVDKVLQAGEERSGYCTIQECPPFIECLVEVGGKLSAKKGVNTPDVILPISPITPKDEKDIEFACKSKEVDWIGMSFVQKAEDMRDLRALVKRHSGESPPKILAKIEKPSAVQDLINILKASDGVMVARGDLGVEMSPEEVPFVQKDIIREAYLQKKPVIVATQMLESMISCPTPTRAECSDVANAILDGCDAVMLSGETAMGKYPRECVQMQRRVIEASERQLFKDKARNGRKEQTDLDTSNAIVASAVTLAEGIGARAIICFTGSGRSAQLLATLRPSVPVLAICPCLEMARWLTLLRGVYATSDSSAQALAARVLQDGPYSVRFTEGMEVACRLARERGLAISEDDTLVVVARLPLFSKGQINCIRWVTARGPKAADGYGPGVDDGSQDMSEIQSGRFKVDAEED